MRRRTRKRVARDGRGGGRPPHTTQPAVGHRLRERYPGLGPQDPALHGRRRLHAGGTGDRGRYVVTRRAGGAGVEERLVAERGVPDEIVLDNGPELAGKALDRMGLFALDVPKWKRPRWHRSRPRPAVGRGVRWQGVE